ncbi:MAG: hypothetical protein PHI27_11600 [Eubacteriales bacterium]|nr:hypothetical protein [Eubacteriales bacterium]MDD3882874.1 hypothetical protein [Eubacteriales bacterium]MDD4512090.1 hypothetical protein [Eubacteriales bacterium]
MTEIKNEIVKTETETQPRYKSWALWLSVFGAIWTILSLFGLTEKIGITDETAKAVVDAVGVILVSFGIVNNPTNKSHL